MTDTRSRHLDTWKPMYEGARQVALKLMVVVLFVVPFPLGSNRDWAWGPLALLVALVAVVQAIGMMGPGPRDSAPLRALIPAAIAFVAGTAWAFLQTHSLLGGNAIVDDAYALLRLARPDRIAVDPEAARTGLVHWLTNALTFWIVANAARDYRQARQFLFAIVASGIVITSYGFLAELAASLRGIFPSIVPKFGNDFSATFVNRNNYATYVGLCALIAIVLISLEGPRPQAPAQPLRLRLRRLAMRLSGTTGVYAAALVILFAGLVQSGSRGGLLCFLCGLLVFWMLGSRRPLIAIGATVVIIGLLLGLPTAGNLLNRFAGLALGSVEGERLEVYGMALQAISLRPWTGWGLGSFAGVYSLLQPIDLSHEYFDLAHNTYLELAVELGVPFGAVLPAVVLWIVGRCFLGLRERSRHREIPALAIAASVLVGVHALVDFSLQIPAVAMTFAAMLGVGWAQSWSSRRESGSGEPDEGASRG